jgi:hypothetical protein
MLWMSSSRPGAKSSAAGSAGAVLAVVRMVTKAANLATRAGDPARKAVVAAALVGLCVFALVPSARAGEYHVYSCRMPNGEVAPTDGWSGSATGAFVYAEDKCAKGGALTAALGDGVEHEASDVATWMLSIPMEETLTGARIWRAGDADGGVSKKGTYEFWLAGPTENEVFDECVYAGSQPCTMGQGESEEPLSAANLLSPSPDHFGSNLYVNAACFATLGLCKKGEHDPNGYAAVVYLYAADLVLEQTSQPKISEVEGELATAATLSGTDDLSFHAEDEGSGVYRAVFTVDGKEVGATVLSSNGGHCQNVAQTTDGLPAFLYLRPCPASLGADVPFDTTTLTDGSHHLVVSVTNAAGNSTVALDRNVTVQNDTKGVDQPTSPSPEGQGPQNTEQHAQPIQIPPQVTSTASGPTVQPQNNGTNATPQAGLRVRWSATARSSLAGVYGRAQGISGRLTTPAGTPIGGAAVQVFDTPLYEQAPTRALGTARTAANGSFSFRTPASTPSASLTFAYSAQLGAPAPSVTASLQLRIPASLSLKIAPRTTQRGGRIVFSGKLRGAPLPPGGKQLVLEARTLSGQWRQFQTLSTGPGGSYRASYRFRLAGPIDYQFRAVSMHEADFPYATGASNVVRVHER